MTILVYPRVGDSHRGEVGGLTLNELCAQRKHAPPAGYSIVQLHICIFLDSFSLVMELMRIASGYCFVWQTPYTRWVGGSQDGP